MSGKRRQLRRRVARADGDAEPRLAAGDGRVAYGRNEKALPLQLFRYRDCPALVADDDGATPMTSVQKKRNYVPTAENTRFCAKSPAPNPMRVFQFNLVAVSVTNASTVYPRS